MSLQAQGRRLAEITAADTSIRQKVCSCDSVPHCVSFVFSRRVQINFFRNYTFKLCVYQRNRRDTICMRYYSLHHICSSAAIISFLTTGAEESENGTGKRIVGIVLKSPLERIPVSYCCASMQAGRAVPSLRARLHCNTFWNRLVTQLPAFVMSHVLDGSHKVCGNMNLGRVQEFDEVTLKRYPL